MDMNRSFQLKKEERNPKWILIDAKGKVLGRLATQIADIIRGKHVPTFTPHADAGDYVVVINAKEVVLTGNKLDQKIYATYSGYMGGLKEKTAAQVLATKPEMIIELAVKRMLPKSKLAAAQFKKLKVYAGSEHPHQAQIKAA